MNKKPPLIKTCPQCGREFSRPPSMDRIKFCGMKCSLQYHAIKPKICQQCGRTFQRGNIDRSSGTGKKFCSSECRGKAAQRRVEFRCADCGNVMLVTPSYVKAHTLCKKCAFVRTKTRYAGKPMLHVTNPDVREAWLRAITSKECRAKISNRLIGRIADTEITRKNSPKHCMALHFSVRSPAGVTYRVDNLCAFVRNNPDLFDAADVVNRSRTRSSYASRATSGLRHLQSRVGTRLSWKGWTLTFGIRDELNRRPIQDDCAAPVN
jgi:hypothetical protein